MNARRNLARSILAIISMCFAAGFLTYSISLSRGYTQLFKADCRSILGGEIVVYARQFGGVIPEGESSWQHRFLWDSPFTDLSQFHPELLQSGYLSVSEEKTSFSEQDLATFASALRDITFVYPRYQLPAVSVDANRHSTPLRGRDPYLDSLQAKRPENLINNGRWFQPGDEYQRIAVVSTRQFLPEGSRVPRVGEIITVEVPRITYINDRAVLQKANPVEYSFFIVGTILVETREFEYTEQLYWHLPEIQIPLSTWQQIWQEVGGKTYYPEQVSLGYSDLSRIEDATMELRILYPQYTISSSAEHIIQAENRGLIETQNIHALSVTQTEDSQVAMPLDLRLPFTVLIFANAALVLASNLLIMVNERREEIGILKAVGSQRRDVVAMVVTEGAVISGVGISIGFIFFRIPAVLTQLTNGQSFASILASIAGDAAFVYASALLFSVIFALLPALRTASLSVMSVMRME